MKPETKQARDLKRITAEKTAEALKVLHQTPDYVWGRIRDIESGTEHNEQPTPPGHFRVTGHAIFWNRTRKQDEGKTGWRDFPNSETGARDALRWIAGFFAEARKQDAAAEYADLDELKATLELYQRRAPTLAGWEPPKDVPLYHPEKKLIVFFTPKPAKDEELYFNIRHACAGIKAKNKYDDLTWDMLHTMGILGKGYNDDGGKGPGSADWIEARGSGQTIPPKGAASFDAPADARNDRARGGPGRRARDQSRRKT